MAAPEKPRTPLAVDPARQQSGPTTESTRKTAALVGVLFLAATIAFIFADMLIGGVLSKPGFLSGAAAETGSLATGAVLLAGQFGVVGIAVLLFPLLKRHGESLALAHVGFRWRSSPPAWCRRSTAWPFC